MRKWTVFLAACILLCLTAGCGKEASLELTVFAAASMTETLTALGEEYMAAHPQVHIVFNFDSSGTLKTQIQEGADCDIFISAGQMQMDQLDITVDASVNTEARDLLLPGSRLDLLENKVVLAAAEDGRMTVASFDALADGLRAGDILLAMGNADVPVGQYSQKILDYYGLSEEDLAAAGTITYGTNVKEVTAQISEGIVDCGIVYQTDVCAAGLRIVDTATAEMCGQVIYPAAVLKNSKNPELAQDFLHYLTGDAGDEVFTCAGFTPVA